MRKQASKLPPKTKVPKVDKLAELNAYGRQTAVGHWYERMIKHLLGGSIRHIRHRIIPNGHVDVQGDLKVVPLKAVVEIKGHEKNDGTFIFNTQFDSHIKELEFLRNGIVFSRYLYAIGMYKNREREPGTNWRVGKIIRSLTRHTKNLRDLYDFLSKRTDHVFLIDIELMQYMRDDLTAKLWKHKYEQHESRPGFTLTASYLCDIARNPDLFFMHIKKPNLRDEYLSDGEHAFLEVAITRMFSGRKLSFNLVLLVDPILREQILDLVHNRMSRVAELRKATSTWLTHKNIYGELIPEWVTDDYLDYSDA